MVEPAMVEKGTYLELLRTASIGIATVGLEKSNGWKLAEYVAGAKAIVTEGLHSEVPGDFRSGLNYLEFTDARECVDRVGDLVSNPVRRLEMMNRNRQYYLSHLRPDKLVLNAIRVALDRPE
jgi:hypothetical protein